jgi:hypothetical protein
MWADDALWIPILLRDSYFNGRFLFDGEQMLGQQLIEITRGQALPWDDPSLPSS